MIQNQTIHTIGDNLIQWSYIYHSYIKKNQNNLLKKQEQIYKSWNNSSTFLTLSPYISNKLSKNYALYEWAISYVHISTWTLSTLILPLHGHRQGYLLWKFNKKNRNRYKKVNRIKVLASTILRSGAEYQVQLHTFDNTI